MNTTQVAIYARVSSEQRTEAQTIASQVAALRERVTADGAVVPEALQFLDGGDSGAKLIRPIENQFYGDRSGGLEDQFGHHWHVSTHIEDVPPAEMQRRMKEKMGGA